MLFCSLLLLLDSRLAAQIAVRIAPNCRLYDENKFAASIYKHNGDIADSMPSFLQFYNEQAFGTKIMRSYHEELSWKLWPHINHFQYIANHDWRAADRAALN